ncbi:hypothetical protein [Aureimonas phyllosphaerae]|uniref:Fido domain-containing protein n=1 Tax=Aureimonas phyllosphaerae TaxID=1166078 RepID=A0A7W6BVK8_9HYPH|nr:hypothetical protein [Aureimonas phyllosphaerae]MBB3937115.1 hypothetical protein [Aureimonas phyllosphaerae]MBB3961248.1 hypothetical protein [Aureimonas phyllosphaerae]SFF52078.1 hypothetical protein SAMN05216566_1219 [Aureimonas phyllosphaerae]
MGLDLAACAFEPWVADFVTASNRLSGIGRAATASEIAAHRGFFARRRVGAGNVVLLRAHLSGPDGRSAVEERPDASTLCGIDELLAADLSPWQLYAAFRDLAPFMHANGRCARALWMSRRLAEGALPQVERLPPEWAREPRSWRRAASALRARRN